MWRRNLLSAGITLLVILFLVGVPAWYFDLGHQPIEKIQLLHGLSVEFVTAQLGQPDWQLDYTMANSPGGEFRIELYNTYPPGDPVAAKAEIKELQWHRARYSIAVWFHRVNGDWAVLDSCRWRKGIVF